MIIFWSWFNSTSLLGISYVCYIVPVQIQFCIWESLGLIYVVTPFMFP